MLRFGVCLHPALSIKAGFFLWPSHAANPSEPGPSSEWIKDME